MSGANGWRGISHHPWSALPSLSFQFMRLMGSRIVRCHIRYSLKLLPQLKGIFMQKAWQRSQDFTDKHLRINAITFEKRSLETLMLCKTQN